MFHVVWLCIHLIGMRPLRNVEDVGGEYLTGKRSLAPVEALWNEWEIHCLILVSLALQAFLFVTAGMRKRSTSLVLRTVLWLAYLSADSVAIFVLGHLAVNASGPRHQLLLFWAPFVLVHLGGQDTITALSVQDNELWTRHLLGLVSQVAVAGYVVSKSSWPDGRLRAAMVLMFLSGSFKYAGRTFCLYSARPANLRAQSLSTLRWKHRVLQYAAQGGGSQATRESLCQRLRTRFDLMLNGYRSQDLLDDDEVIEIMTVDAPLNAVESVVGRDDLPRMLEMFSRSVYRCGAYEYVGGQLVNCYERLYTKRPLLQACYIALLTCSDPLHSRFRVSAFSSLYLITTLIQCLSTPVALVLFWVAEKAGQLHSRADVTVSYVLLVGAILLDVLSAFMFTFCIVRSRRFPDGRIKRAILRVANYIQAAAGSRKQWSEKLAQYSMIKRYGMQNTVGMSSVQQWIRKRLNDCGVELLDPSLTHKPITEDLKKFVLDKLLAFGTGEQDYWNFTSFRGQLALRRRMYSAETALHKNIDEVDFPTSVLIWHIATDICFYFEDNASTNSDQMKRSRELSNYILYLVFKCGVMLTSHSQHVHSEVHEELRKIFADQQVNLREKEAVMKVFEDKKDEQSASTVTETKKHEESANTDSATSRHLQEHLQSTAESIYSPVLPRAREVAQELIGIDNGADCWELIAAVWLEMLYYTAPRCGGAFHYQHLSTGGEFITHVLALMYFLGPFLPTPGA